MPITIKDNLKIDITETEYGKKAKITPKEFWADVVQVCQDKQQNNPIIMWSSGGQNGTESNIDTINYFIEALKEAKNIAIDWQKKSKILGDANGPFNNRYD